MESDKRCGVVADRLGTRLLSGPKGVRFSPAPPNAVITQWEEDRTLNPAIGVRFTVAAPKYEPF